MRDGSSWGDEPLDDGAGEPGLAPGEHQGPAGSAPGEHPGPFDPAPGEHGWPATSSAPGYPAPGEHQGPADPAPGTYAAAYGFPAGGGSSGSGNPAGYPSLPFSSDPYPSDPYPPAAGHGPADAQQPPGDYGAPGGYQPAGGFPSAGGYDPSGGYQQPGGYPSPAGYQQHQQPGGYQPPGFAAPPGFGPAGQYAGGGFPPPGQAAPLGHGTPPRRRRGRGLVAYLLVALLAAGAGAGTVYWLDGRSPSASADGGTPPAPGVSHGGVSRSSIHSVISSVRPGLVDISSTLSYEGAGAAATGMIISKDGLVLTNNHVIQNTTGLTATVIGTGQRFAARWLGYDAADDVAVIKLIGAHNLHPVRIGDSGTVKVGATVIAVGNAEGLGTNPAVLGTITGLNRTIRASEGGANSETLHGMLQTDAAIVQGDSGGALVNTAGQVIGMNTAAQNTGLGAGQPSIAFAIPINKALAIAHRITSGQGGPGIQIGSTGFLGVLVPASRASLSTSPARQRQLQLQQDQPGLGFGVPPATTHCLPNDANAGVPKIIAPARQGALIIGELCGTPAARAGLVAGDVILAVGSHAVTSPNQLNSVMVGYRPGKPVTVTWEDVKGRVHHSTLLLAPRPPK